MKNTFALLVLLCSVISAHAGDTVKVEGKLDDKTLTVTVKQISPTQAEIFYDERSLGVSDVKKSGAYCYYEAGNDSVKRISVGFHNDKNRDCDIHVGSTARLDIRSGPVKNNLIAWSIGFTHAEVTEL